MQTRRNALLAASRLVGEVHRIGTGYSDHARGTVGFLVVKPNSRNVVPGEVRMSVDLRSAKQSTLDAMVDELRRCIAAVQDACRVEVGLQEVVSFAAMVFVPCEGGISHNELESARPEHLAAGCDVLLHAVLRRAGASGA